MNYFLRAATPDLSEVKFRKSIALCGSVPHCLALHSIDRAHQNQPGRAVCIKLSPAPRRVSSITDTMKALSSSLAVVVVAFTVHMSVERGHDGQATHYWRHHFDMAVQNDEPPLYNSVTHGYVYGRWRKPIQAEVTFAGLGRMEKLWNLKQFDYTSISTDQYFIGFALVSLQYVSEVFLYIVDKNEDPSNKFDFDSLVPGGPGVRLSASSHTGCSEGYNPFPALLSPYLIRKCWDEPSRSWNISVDLTARRDKTRDSHHIQVQATMNEREAMAFVYPIEDRRPAYVHKGAGLPVSGFVSIDGKHHSFANGLGSLDWTYSLAKHETRWKWVSLSVRAQVEGKDVDLGINLSEWVYDVPEHGSVENAVWIDGTVHPVDGIVDIVTPDGDLLVDAWLVKSRKEAKVQLDLTCKPLGFRAVEVNAGVLVNNFVQPYGIFEGTVVLQDGRRVVVKDAMGVVERHHAGW